MSDEASVSPWEPAYALIRRREGFAPVAKWDYAQYSGGYGTKSAPGEKFDRDKAEARMRQEVQPLTSYLDANVKVPMTDAQRAALVSFGYNTGLGSLQKITPDINSGNWADVASRIQGWNKAGGSVLSDLVNRRAEEGAMLTGGAPVLAQRAAPTGIPNPMLVNAMQSAQAAPQVATPPDAKIALSERLMALVGAMQPKAEQPLQTAPIQMQQPGLLRPVSFQKNALLGDQNG